MGTDESPVSETDAFIPDNFGLKDLSLPEGSVGDPANPVFARCIFPLPNPPCYVPVCKTSEGRILSPAHDIPVFHTTDVAVVGGGVAGFAAALAAARAGAKVALIEKDGSLGGLFTNGMVLIVLATSRKESNGRWTLVAKGICQEFARRAGSLGAHVVRGKENEMAPWLPTIDPEAAKYLMDCMIAESKVEMFFHGYGINVIKEGNAVRGVVFHSKEGPKAILAKTVVDATGDGDIAFAAGAPYRHITHGIGSVARFGNVDRITADRPPSDPGVSIDGTPNVWPLRGNEANPSTYWRGRLGPTGDGLSVRDLSQAEVAHRKYWWEFVAEMRKTPGWEAVYLANTCSQIGLRATRIVESDLVVDRALLRSVSSFDDTIGWVGEDGPCPAMPVRYRSLLPKGVDNLLCAGRMLGAPDTVDSFRLIAPCFVTGQAAGIAAALAAKKGVAPRSLPYADLRDELLRQEVYL